MSLEHIVDVCMVLNAEIYNIEDSPFVAGNHGLNLP